MANVFLNDLKLQKVWDAIRKNFYPVPPESGTAQPPTPAMEGDITIAFGRYTSGQYQGYLNSIVSTIGDGKVTTSKLADSAVTKAKLAAGAIDPVVTWGNGTTAGPTITVQAGKDTSVPKAVPAATAEYSGIITTTTQTVSGNKTFKGNILGEQNIEALFGVSAHGHADLSIAAGGGAGTVTCISVNDAVKEPDGTGMITLDDYPTLTAYNADKTRINSAISQINSKIPIAATASNQLADKEFVNSSINTATATFRGTYTAANDTEAAAQTALAGITTKDLNDYAFVKVENTPQTGIDKYKRYKYNGNNWSYEYTLNNSSFTASQWDAINSTITSAKVAAFNAKYDKPATGIPATDLDSQTQTLLVLASTALQRVDFFNLGDHDTPVYFNAHGYGQVIDALSVPGNIESTGGGVAAHGHADLGISAGGGSGTTTAVRIGNGSPIEAVDGVVTIPTTQISQQPDGTIALGGVAIAVKGLGSFAYRSSINLSEVVGATDVVSSLSNAISQTHAMAQDNAENIVLHDDRITDLESYFDGASAKYALDADKVDGHHASEFVGSLGVSGNNLTWTRIGGTAQNITVPYASNAGQLGGHSSDWYQQKVTALGSATQPVYISAAGTFSAGSTYAGGTKVTLNGSDKGASTASFYAPATAGTLGYWLKSSGSGAPVWESQANMLAGRATRMEQETMQETQEFIFRNSPKTIGADSLKLDRILGRTLVWNQMASIPSSSKSGTFNGITITDNRDGSYKLNGTATSAYAISIRTTIVFAEHKYYLSISGSNGDAYVDVSGYTNWYQTPSTAASVISKCKNTNTSLIEIFWRNGVTFDNITVRAKVIDLTLMFGAGNEPSTVAEFEALYPNAYYEYNAGELRNNDAKGLETVGFNLYGGKLEFGNLAPYPDGGSNSYIRTTEYVSAFSGQYYFNWRNVPARGSDYQLYGLFYDGGKNIISRSQLSAASSTTEILGTAPAGTRYIKAFIYSATGFSSAELNSIEFCLNKSDASKNGQYEPYKRSVLDLHLDNIQVKSPNIWDEEWVHGTWDASGIYQSSYNNVCAKNYIKIKPNTTYYFGGFYNIYICFYDKDKLFIPARRNTYGESTQIYTSPANAEYMTFVLGIEYGTTYNNNICINESSSFNGQYEPHGILTIKGLGSVPGSITMRSQIFGANQDEIQNQKLTKRIERIVFDGTESWNKSNGIFKLTDWYAGHLLPYYKTYVANVGQGGVGLCNLLGQSYLTNGAVTGTFSLLVGDANWGFDISESAIPNGANMTASQFKDWLAQLYAAGTPMTLDYLIATPIEYDLVSPIPTAMPAGTTERIISDRLPVTPFACDMTYGTNPGDILASGVAWEKIWGRPTIVHDKSNVSLSTLDRHVIKIGDKELYLIFSVGSDGTSYTLRVATGLNNGVYENEQVFNFATIDDTTINNICHL